MARDGGKIDQNFDERQVARRLFHLFPHKVVTVRPAVVDTSAFNAEVAESPSLRCPRKRLPAVDLHRLENSTDDAIRYSCK